MTIYDHALGLVAWAANAFDLGLLRKVSLWSAIAAGGGAITEHDVITWTGVALAVISALITAFITAHHKLREALRAEDAADRQRVADDMKEQLRTQIRMEEQIAKNAARLDELTDRTNALWGGPAGSLHKDGDLAPKTIPEPTKGSTP